MVVVRFGQGDAEMALSKMAQMFWGWGGGTFVTYFRSLFEKLIFSDRESRSWTTSNGD